MRMVVGDHIGYRFELLSRLGKGSFGQVCVCLCAVHYPMLSFIFKQSSAAMKHLLPHGLY